MTPERWQQIERLFHSALERDVRERAAFLDQACAGDEALRQAVASLLASDEQAASLTGALPAEVAAEMLAEQQARSAVGRKIGHYQVLSQIGAGGMGEVYLAQDTKLGRKIALKMLPNEFTRDRERVQRFIWEARAASALNHPNIITIHEIGQVEGTHFIATEYIEGQTLRQRITGAQMKLREVLDVAVQVASALAAAHEAGIVHRDLKPENIMLRRDGYVKVLDFGLAKLIERSSVEQTTVADTESSIRGQISTSPGKLMGTARYMSPEQILGQEVDGRSDIFSLGIVLYEMVTGRAPFEGATPEEVMGAIIHQEPQPLERYAREAPAELARMASKALVKDREERYQVIKDLLLDLKSLKEELEFEAKLKRASSPGVSGGQQSEAAGESLTLAYSIPPKTFDSRSHNLPVEPMPLIGRDQEVAEVEQLLRPAGRRLLTLTGPGGTGKTRLSLQVAAELSEEFENGVYFVSLASIGDPGLVATAIAQALGVKESGEQPLSDRLKEYLRDKQMLLLLDNFEQVVAAAPLVAELLAACPRLKVLATSRAALHVRGEYEFLVPPLEVPDLSQPSIEALAQYPSVELFVQRAKEVRRDFGLTQENAPAVAEICARLDGLPLAIELAAARIKLLTPQAVLQRLENRLKLLTGGARDLPARQQTMRGAIAWSYDLLDEGEKRIFRQLSVFVGGCTLETVEAVCSGEDELRIEVLDGIESLVDKSLLQQREQSDGEFRFTLLETVREFGLEQLALSGEAEVVRRRHATFFLGLAERAEPELTGAEQVTWLKRLEREHDNLRAALHWAKETAESEVGLRLSGALGRFWFMLGHLTEGQGWLEEFLAPTESGGSLASVRAKALRHQGVLAKDQGNYPKAESLFEESLSLYRGLGDKRGIALSLMSLGSTMFELGDRERAVVLHKESLGLLRAAGDQWGAANVLNNLGAIHYEQGDYQQAKALFQESLTMCRELGDERGIVMALNNLGEVARHQGDYQRAKALFAEALILDQKLGDKMNRAALLECLAELSCAEGQLARSAQLFGAAEALREAINAPLPPHNRADYESSVMALRAGLSEEALAAAWAQGRAMMPEHIIADALG